MKKKEKEIDAPREKKRKEPVKKRPHDKSEQYIMRKNTIMRILRVCLWGMLVFVFIRGVVSIFQRDKEDVVAGMINEFKANYSNFTNQNGEVLSFAQNFAKEYLTYEARGEEEYKNRLQGYVSTDFFSGSVQDFRASAAAVYLDAYRLEEYSENQVDIYVQAEVEYRTRQDEEGGMEEVSRNSVILKVPVYISTMGYIVESIPQFVADTVWMSGYRADDYIGGSVSEEETEQIKISVQNFLKAYLEADKSVISYYLDAAADKGQFQGLGGRFTLYGVDEVRCYKNEDSTDFVCLAAYRVQDSQNGAVMSQKINLTMRESGGKYYIKTMDTRTGNLNVK